jgi:hypothetical protein
MRSSRTPRVILAGITAAIGVALFFVIVPETVTDATPLANAIISSPNIPGISNTSAYSVLVSTIQLPFPALVAAGKSDPAHSGSWAKQWLGTKTNAGGDLQIEFNLAPSASVAAKAATEAKATSLSKSALTSGGRVHGRLISVAPLDGSGATFTLAPTKGSKAAVQRGVELFFHSGRALIEETLTETRPQVIADAMGVAQREAALVARVVPTLPPIRSTRFPLGSASVVLALTVVGSALVSFIPLFADAARRRREAELARRAEHHRRVRGAKALKSQRRRY